MPKFPNAYSFYFFLFFANAGVISARKSFLSSKLFSRKQLVWLWSLVFVWKPVSSGVCLVGRGYLFVAISPILTCFEIRFFFQWPHLGQLFPENHQLSFVSWVLVRKPVASNLQLEKKVRFHSNSFDFLLGSPNFFASFKFILVESTG